MHVSISKCLTMRASCKVLIDAILETHQQQDDIIARVSVTYNAVLSPPLINSGFCRTCNLDSHDNCQMFQPML